MSFIIDAIEYYLPERVIDNHYLAETCGIDFDFLENKVGIKQRHIAAENESITDMAVKACQELFQKNSIQETDIDFLLLCTQNPDFKLPTTACILQDKLQINKTCFAFDINLGCSGFIYSLILAQSFLHCQSKKNALIVMVDQYSKVIDYSDKNTASIFGDAASACLIKKSDNNNGIIDSLWGTDGSGFDKLIVRNSGLVKELDKSQHLYMHGREIFKFSMKVAPETVLQILERNTLEIEDIKYFIFHQANKYMLSEIQKRLNISNQQMIIDMENYGNTISSTIPIAYSNLLKKQDLQKGDKIIFCGFGVGLSWGAILYIFN